MEITNILERIVAYKKEEINSKKTAFPVDFLETQPGMHRKTYSLKDFLLDAGKTGIIAEFKRRSPSRGVINGKARIEEVTAAYNASGASGLSILTDSPSFGGSEDDLKRARFNTLPILRKDFIIDPYQLFESRVMGADAILLIAACLKPSETVDLAKKAKSLGLEVLLEIHQEEELDHLCDEIDIVGINNRDLKSFSVDIDRSVRLAGLLPRNKIRIAESGIRDIDTLLKMKSAGFHGFLIGEQFMQSPEPSIAFASFVDQLKIKLHESKSLRDDATRSGQEA